MKYLFILLLFIVPQLTFASYSSYSRNSGDNPLPFADQPLTINIDVAVEDECGATATAWGFYVDDSVNTPSVLHSVIGSFAGSFALPELPVSPQVRFSIYYWVDSADIGILDLSCSQNANVDDFVIEGSTPPSPDLTSLNVQVFAYLTFLFFMVFFAIIYLIKNVL